MEDKQLNAAESIALISRMIDNTRNRMPVSYTHLTLPTILRV